MIYCGIDLSLTGTGIICLDDNLNILIQKLIKTKSESLIEDRYIYIYDIISKLINKYEDKIINIEGLSFNSKNSQRYLELAGLHYYIRTNFKYYNLNYKITPPTILKKFVTGKGNCKKNLILLNVYKKWDIEFNDDNTADAYGLARFLYEENINGNTI